MFRMKRVNLQHSSYEHVFSKSILVENNADTDQTALHPQCYQKSPTRVFIACPKITKKEH